MGADTRRNLIQAATIESNQSTFTIAQTQVPMKLRHASHLNVEGDILSNAMEIVDSEEIILAARAVVTSPTS